MSMENESMISWDITPPSSPQSRSILEDDGTIPFQWFSCSGEVNYKDNKLNSHSFILNGEIKVINDYSTIWKKLKAPVVLFGKNFDQDSALLFNCKLLFHMAWKNLMVLDSTSRLNYHVISKVPISSTETDKYKQIREQNCELLSFTRSYLARVLSERNSVGVIEKLISVVPGNILALIRYLRRLKDLPGFVVTHSANSLGNKCLQASYHLFHVHLDLRWYCLTIEHLIMKCRQLLITQDDCEENVNTLEEYISFLISELVQIAIDRFEKIPLNSITKKSPFNCSCVKELWLMIQFYLNKLHEEENGKTFWTYLNEVLDVVLSKKTPVNTSVSSSILNIPSAYKCSDPPTFCAWILVHIVQLNGYTEDGEFVGTASGRIMSNYPQLEAILKICMAADTNMTEPQLRVIISFVATLVTEWWEVRTEPVMILWEYYHRRLNCAFYIPGATPDTVAVMSKTGIGLLEQVKSCLYGTSQQDANSFNLFLNLLGRHLRHCTVQNQHNQWQKMKGRIYSKFSPSKMLSLTETGLYHLVCLFLSLAITVSLREIGNKLQDLLSLLPAQSVDTSRLHIMMKANIALILLYVEKGFDIAGVSQQLQILVMDLCSQKNHNSLMLMRTYVEGLQDVISASHSLRLSEHCLIGGWIPQFLSNSTVSDSCRLLDTVINIIVKVRQSFTNFMDEELDHNRKMAEVLFQHVLPCIQAEYGNVTGQPPFQVADVAAGFSLLALEQPGIQGYTFHKLFIQFVNSDKVNVKLQKRYLCHVLPGENVVTLMTNENSGIENIVIQAWVRCSMLSVNDSTDDLSHLTRIVSRLPAVQSLYQLTGIVLAETDDTLFTFIRVMGASYRSLQDIHRKAAFRERCVAYLVHVEKCVESVVNCATSSSELVSRIYVCVACIIYHCSQLLYVKSKPDCPLPRLVQLLLLPHAIYKPETQLHSHVAAAIKKTLHQFIFGIFKLNPKCDEFVARVLRDIITQYMTRLVNRSATIPGVFVNHPLLKCCTENENSELCRFVLETVSNKFISCKGNAPQEYATLAFLFLTDVITVKKYSKDILHQIIDVSLLKILELVMFVEAGHSARKCAVEVIKLIINSDTFSDENTKLRDSFVSVIISLCQKHIAFSSSYVFKLCISVGQLSRDLMLNCLPQLQELVSNVEHRRGVGYDSGLRNSLGKVIASLGAE